MAGPSLWGGGPKQALIMGPIILPLDHYFCNLLGQARRLVWKCGGGGVTSKLDHDRDWKKAPCGRQSDPNNITQTSNVKHYIVPLTNVKHYIVPLTTLLCYNFQGVRSIRILSILPKWLWLVAGSPCWMLTTK